MTRDDVLARLRDVATELGELGIARVAVFGSFARGEARDDSDIDLLVEFADVPDLIEFIRVKNRLGVLLGRDVDLVTPDALHPYLRDDILREAVYA